MTYSFRGIVSFWFGNDRWLPLPMVCKVGTWGKISLLTTRISGLVYLNGKTSRWLISKYLILVFAQ